MLGTPLNKETSTKHTLARRLALIHSTCNSRLQTELKLPIGLQRAASIV